MIRKFFDKLLKRSGGFTLVEVVVVTGLLTLTTGLVGTTVFQSLSIERFWRDGVVATKDLRHATSQFSRDALVAETTDLVDGGASKSTVTLDWTDGLDVAHTATYSVVNSNLIRDLDGNQLTLARGVSSTTFALDQNVLTFDLEVEGELGTTKSISLQTYLRLLTP